MPAKKKAKTKYPRPSRTELSGLTQKVYYAQMQLDTANRARDEATRLNQRYELVLQERASAKASEDRRFDALFNKLVDASRTTTTQVSAR